jgi:hypothetical protein
MIKQALNFKGIKSTVKSECGRTIVSGQKVICHGRINPPEVCEVFFEPNHGFRIQGNNLADAYVTKIVSNPTLIERAKGVALFAAYCLFNQKTLS